MASNHYQIPKWLTGTLSNQILLESAFHSDASRFEDVQRRPGASFGKSLTLKGSSTAYANGLMRSFSITVGLKERYHVEPNPYPVEKLILYSIIAIHKIRTSLFSVMETAKVRKHLLSSWKSKGLLRWQRVQLWHKWFHNFAGTKSIRFGKVNHGARDFPTSEVCIIGIPTSSNDTL